MFGELHAIVKVRNQNGREEVNVVRRITMMIHRECKKRKIRVLEQFAWKMFLKIIFAWKSLIEVIALVATKAVHQRGIFASRWDAVH